MNFEFITNEHSEDKVNVQLFQYFSKYDFDFISTWNPKLNVDECRKNLVNDFFEYCYNDSEIDIKKISDKHKSFNILEKNFIKGIISKLSQNDIGVLLLRCLVTFYKKQYGLVSMLPYNDYTQCVLGISFVTNDKYFSSMSITRMPDGRVYPFVFFHIKRSDNFGVRVNCNGDISWLKYADGGVDGIDRAMFHELTHIMYHLFYSIRDIAKDNLIAINKEIFNIEKKQYLQDKTFGKFFHTESVCLQFYNSDIRCIFGLFKRNGKYYMDLINETLYDFFDGKKVIRCNYNRKILCDSDVFVIPDLFTLYDNIDDLKNKMKSIFVVEDSFIAKFYIFIRNIFVFNI